MQLKKLLLFILYIYVSFPSHADSFKEKLDNINKSHSDSWQVNITDLPSIDNEQNLQAFIQFGDGDSVVILNQGKTSSQYYFINYILGKQAIYSDLIFDNEYHVEIYNRLNHLSSGILSTSSENKLKIEDELKKIITKKSNTHSTLTVDQNTNLILDIIRSDGKIIFIQLVIVFNTLAA